MVAKGVSAKGVRAKDIRYLDSTLGRFEAPDPVAPVDAKTGKVNATILAEPQRLNAYAYGLNGPGRYVDISGNFVLHIDKLDAKEQNLVKCAVSRVQQAVESDPSIVSYFDRFGYDIKRAVTPGEGPDVYIDKSSPYHGDSRGFYDQFKLGGPCFTDKDQMQSLFSTLSHELGHMAENWSQAYYGKEPDISDLFSRPYYQRDKDDRVYGYTSEWVMTGGIWTGRRWLDKSQW